MKIEYDKSVNKLTLILQRLQLGFLEGHLPRIIISRF